MKKLIVSREKVFVSQTKLYFSAVNLNLKSNSSSNGRNSSSSYHTNTFGESVKVPNYWFNVRRRIHKKKREKEYTNCFDPPKRRNVWNTFHSIRLYQFLNCILLLYTSENEYLHANVLSVIRDVLSHLVSIPFIDFRDNFLSFSHDKHKKKTEKKYVE